MLMTSFRPARLALLLGCSLLAACQSFGDGDARLHAQGQAMLDGGPQPAAVPVAPEPQPAPQPGPEPLPDGPRFDVSAIDMDARSFFLGLMESAGENIVLHPQVGGQISFSLRDVTLQQVLAAVRDSYGYDFRRTSYGWRILPNQLQTRTYDIDYLNLQRMGDTDTRISSGQVVLSDSTEADGVGVTSSTQSRTVSASQVVTRSEVDFWRELQAVVSALVGEEPGNRVMINPQASLLVVRASAGDQQSVQDFLQQAQQNLQRQVVLEAKIIEVQLADGFEAGINWAQIGRERNADFRLGMSGAALEGLQDVGGVFSAALSVGDFSGLLQLLETQGRVRVLSSPRISTLNNQKAVIKVGSDEYFVTGVSTTTTTLSNGSTSPDLDLELTPFFSGISLDVTPQINAEGEVTLHVRPSVSRVQDQQKVITLGNADNEFVLPLALSTTRQSDSIVRARSGQLIVIGGLMQNSSDDSDAGVPWLQDLPLLGGAFRQQRRSLGRSELVILLRPQVVGSETWSQQLQQGGETLRSLQ